MFICSPGHPMRNLRRPKCSPGWWILYTMSERNGANLHILQNKLKIFDIWLEMMVHHIYLMASIIPFNRSISQSLSALMMQKVRQIFILRSFFRVPSWVIVACLRKSHSMANGYQNWKFSTNSPHISPTLSRLNWRYGSALLVLSKYRIR
jgi:hypothetical protein